MLVSAQSQGLESKPESPGGLARPLLASSHPSCSPFSQLSPSFAEKNCSYFRHFNPGESSEIFEVTTQKGEPGWRVGRGRKSGFHYSLLSWKIPGMKAPGSCLMTSSPS